MKQCVRCECTTSDVHPRKFPGLDTLELCDCCTKEVSMDLSNVITSVGFIQPQKPTIEDRDYPFDIFEFEDQSDPDEVEA